ncbi:MAG TPA: hypothetical protein VLW53_13625 [Candidatus Eisenbacteria bacterium]|nr:hypothetical protein [Candidatus Eisenbacteria bacterium]
MYARRTLVDVEQGRIRELVTFVEQRVRLLAEALEGNTGLTMLTDRRSGRGVVTTIWGTEPAMHASVSPVGAVLDEAAGRFGATPVSEEFRIAELHRLREGEPGFWSRSTRFEFAPADADLVVDTYRTTTVPPLDLLPGFCSAALFVDRRSGRGVSTVTFDSHAALVSSRTPIQEIRQVSADKAQARVGESLELEVAITAMNMPREAR